MLGPPFETEGTGYSELFEPRFWLHSCPFPPAIAPHDDRALSWSEPIVRSRDEALTRSRLTHPVLVLIRLTRSPELDTSMTRCSNIESGSILRKVPRV